MPEENHGSAQVLTLARFQQVKELLSRDEPGLALETLDDMLRGQPASVTEHWHAEHLRSLCLLELGEPQQAIMHLWESLGSAPGQPRSNQQYNYSNYLFMLHYLPDMEGELLRERSFLYQQFASAEEAFRHSRQEHRRHGKLRIGYLAPRFTQGVVSRFTGQMLTGYDRERYEVCCYSCLPGDDELTKSLRHEVDRWYVPVQGKARPRELAQRIYNDGADILFDLGGHTAGGLTLQVMMYKPAPVQISGIGYMSTTGLKTVDYYLGDIYCDPAGSEVNFCEKILRLPHSHFCYTPAKQVRCVRKPHEGVVFGSFNNLLKVNDEVLSVWAEILKRVPDSRLLLKVSRYNPQAMQKLRRRAESVGIEGRRLSVEQPESSYMERYNEVDIALDTFPYVGGGTTCDALYMGVPVISLYGRRHSTRFGYSLLMNAGVGELAAATEAEYIEKAVMLAGDKELLAALHEGIPQMVRRSQLMDAAAYMRDLQAAYEDIWHKWLIGS